MPPRAERMTTRAGWNYETDAALYQLWPPVPGWKQWSAAWTERRPLDVDPDDEEWHGGCDFKKAGTPIEAMQCFPEDAESERARRALQRAAKSYQT